MNAEEAARLRREYDDFELDIGDLAESPLAQFAVWFSGATAAGIDEPNAFVLATVGSGGRPSARAVLMKEYTAESLVFYTNMESRKSMEMMANPSVAATFVWTPIHRQVRFEGATTQLDPALADAYFATRPRGAQLAAHASHQSRPVASREQLEQAYNEYDTAFGDTIPRPDTWGGWEIRVERAEFWQGRSNRFHDRFRYTPEGSSWSVQRLQP